MSSYFAVKRFIAEEIIRYEHAYPYVIGLVLRSTKNIVNVEVNHRDRWLGVSGYTLGKLLNLWEKYYQIENMWFLQCLGFCTGSIRS